MAFSIKNKNLKGCLFGAPNPKDYKTVFKDTTVPDKVDLRANCTIVEDQGAIGSCTANAAVGALEYLYTVRDGQAPQLSRLFVYFNARRMRGSANVDSGAYISDAMASVMAFGACREETWPYDVTTFSTEPTRVAYDEAMNYEAIQYSRVDAVDGSIQALAAGFPVVFGARIPARCYEKAAKTGIMPVPSQQEVVTNQEGGHCMLIVGYDNPARMFIVRNSWGESWGDRGYCKIPYDVFNMCAPRDCFWIIGELEKPGNYTLIRPGKVAARPAAAPPAPAVPTTAKSSGLAEKAAKMREEIRSSLDAEIDASSKRIEKILSGTPGGNKPVAGPTSPRAGWELCPMCFGTGRCRACDATQGDCRVCGNTRTCYRCNGSGKVEVFSPTGEKPAAKPVALFKQKFGDQYVCPNCGYVSSSPGACPYCSGEKPVARPTSISEQKFGEGYACRRCGSWNVVNEGDWGRGCRWCVDCSICQGTKICLTCQGAGGALAEGCEACRNTGKCWKCGGKGWEGGNWAPVPETIKGIALSKQKFGDQYVCPNCGYVSSSPGACPYCSGGGKPAARPAALSKEKFGNTYSCPLCGSSTIYHPGAGEAAKCAYCISCGECYGRKECPTCYGNASEEEPCGRCGTSGICRTCDGKGWEWSAFPTPPIVPLPVQTVTPIALTKQRFGDQYVCPNCGYVSSSPGACPYCSGGGKPAARPIALSKQKFGDQYVCPNCGYVSSSPGTCPYCSGGGKPAARAMALSKQKFGDQYVCPNCGYVSSSPGACPYCS